MSPCPHAGVPHAHAPEPRPPSVWARIWNRFKAVGRWVRRNRLYSAALVLTAASFGILIMSTFFSKPYEYPPLPEANIAEAPEPAPVPKVDIDAEDAMCGGRFMVTVGDSRYLLVPSSAGGSPEVRLIDVDANSRDQPCHTGYADEAHTAQRFVMYDRPTGGCVRVTAIDDRMWILSDGWGLIPAADRLDFDSMCSTMQIPGSPPRPPVVKPIEDTRGYEIDSRVGCPGGTSYEEFHFVPALGTCIPFDADDGYRIRGDLAKK